MSSKSFAEARKFHQQYIDGINAMLDKHGANFEAVLVEVEKLVVPQRVSFDSSGMTISIAGDKHILQAVWGALARKGFKFPSHSSRPKTNDASWSGFFYAGGVEDEDRGEIYLAYSSTVCRRVKVGTETVVRDVYETVCGEVELPT